MSATATPWLVEAPLAWPDVLGDYLSASRLNLLQRCPEQYRRRYLHGEYEPINTALVWGGADHYAAEQNYRQKIESHEDISLDDCKLAFAEGFDRKAAEGDVQWGDAKPGEVKDAGVKLAACYHEYVAPTVQPIGVEERFEVVIPGLPVPVIGYMDVLAEGRAIERKTIGAKTTTIKPRWRIQGLVYQLANGTPVDYHVSVKTKTPAVYTADLEPGLRLVDSRSDLTARLIRNLATQLVSMLETFGPDDPWPGAITDDWACGYCGFGPRGSNDCEWWS